MFGIDDPYNSALPSFSGMCDLCCLVWAEVLE